MTVERKHGAIRVWLDCDSYNDPTWTEEVKGSIKVIFLNVGQNWALLVTHLTIGTKHCQQES